MQADVGCFIGAVWPTPIWWAKDGGRYDTDGLDKVSTRRGVSRRVLLGVHRLRISAVTSARFGGLFFVLNFSPPLKPVTKRLAALAVPAGRVYPPGCIKLYTLGPIPVTSRLAARAAPPGRGTCLPTECIKLYTLPTQYQLPNG